MADSGKKENMVAFGSVMNEMMDWFIANKPEMAQEWLERLDAIMWKNYLTPKEAQMIVSEMNPQAPWSREQWKSAMVQKGYPMEKEPCYNSCALWVTMDMIMSDSSETITKYIGQDELFDFV